jgi:transposase
VVVVVDKGWVGVDVGKGFHWAVVLDEAGEVLLSRRVENDEADILALVDEARAFGRELSWATDQPGGTAALLLALLWQRGERVIYVPGMVVDRARGAYRGESKTDRIDARLIADQARMRRDLSPLEAGEEALAEMGLLVAHRRDLVVARTRAITRLRETLLCLFPGLERVLDLNRKGALVLVSRYRTPSAVRRSGRKRIAAYLRARGVRNADALAGKVVAAAEGQSVRLPAEGVAADIVSELAAEALSLKERIARADVELEGRFFAHPLAEIVVSLPGMGPLLGAEFLVAVGDPRAFGSAEKLAAYAGLVPAARDSGKRVGNHRRMRGGNKLLKKVLYQAAFSSLRTSPQSRAFYDRKRDEGKRHQQTLVALARRRVDVLWAMLRDGATFKAPSAA